MRNFIVGIKWINNSEGNLTFSLRANRRNKSLMISLVSAFYIISLLQTVLLIFRGLAHPRHRIFWAFLNDSRIILWNASFHSLHFLVYLLLFFCIFYLHPPSWRKWLSSRKLFRVQISMVGLPLGSVRETDW